MSKEPTASKSGYTGRSLPKITRSSVNKVSNIRLAGMKKSHKIKRLNKSKKIPLTERSLPLRKSYYPDSKFDHTQVNYIAKPRKSYLSFGSGLSGMSDNDLEPHKKYTKKISIQNKKTLAKNYKPQYDQLAQKSKNFRLSSRSVRSRSLNSSVYGSMFKGENMGSLFEEMRMKVQNINK